MTLYDLFVHCLDIKEGQKFEIDLMNWDLKETKPFFSADFNGLELVINETENGNLKVSTFQYFPKTETWKITLVSN